MGGGDLLQDFGKLRCRRGRFPAALRPGRIFERHIRPVSQSGSDEFVKRGRAAAVPHEPRACLALAGLERLWAAIIWHTSWVSTQAGKPSMGTGWSARMRSDAPAPPSTRMPRRYSQFMAESNASRSFSVGPSQLSTYSAPSTRKSCVAGNRMVSRIHGHADPALGQGVRQSAASSDRLEFRAADDTPPTGHLVHVSGRRLPRRARQRGFLGTGRKIRQNQGGPPANVFQGGTAFGSWTEPFRAALVIRRLPARRLTFACRADLGHPA